MLKGQKSVRGGIEDFLCPFTDMYITQAPNGSYTHKGTMAVDVRGIESGVRYPYYAPCTVKCIKAWESVGQVMWQSVNNVRCSNGYIGKVTFMTCHDDNMNAYAGLIVPQGNQLGNMGVKGNATGVHCHIEFSQSDDTSWYKNQYGNYMFNYEFDPEDVWFMDNTNVISGNGKWKYLKDVPVYEPAPTPVPLPEPTPIEPDITEELQKRIEELEYQVSQLNAVQEVLEKENAELKEQLAEQPTLLFTCESDCTIKYKMLKGEKLYTK